MNPNTAARGAPLGSEEFLQKTLDSMLSHVAILEADGTIIAVNAAWNRYACGNGLEEDLCGPGANYLRACDRASGACSEEAGLVAQGIRDVVAGRRPSYQLEYPCHSPTEQRWSCVRITGFSIDGDMRVVVSHDNITERVLAEIQVREANLLLQLQATTDGLTGIANRRSFDETLDREWWRHHRDFSPLSLAMLDVDCFKLYNDREGHLAGDDCLKAVARAIRDCMQRAGDFAGRYGGEEFALILPNTGVDGANVQLRKVLDRVRRLAIPHPDSEVGRGTVTVSIGVATTIPSGNDTLSRFLDRADKALYRAKAGGRDQLIAAERLEADLALV